MEEPERVETYNVVFTKKVTQKQKKGWVDGVATFRYDSSNGQVICSLVDEEGKQVTKGRVPSDKIPVEVGMEIVVSPVLIQINEQVDSTEKPGKTTNFQTARKEPIAIQRPGLRRTGLSNGFKPPQRITPIIHERVKPPSPEPIQKRSPEKSTKEPSDRLKKFMVQHIRGQFPPDPEANDDSDDGTIKKIKKTNDKTSKRNTTQDDGIIKREVNKKEKRFVVVNNCEMKVRKEGRATPRTWTEILKFYDYDSDEGGDDEGGEKKAKSEQKTTTKEEKGKKEHTPAHVILAGFQNNNSSDDEELESDTPTQPQPPSWKKQSSSSDDFDLSDEDNPKKKYDSQVEEVLRFPTPNASNDFKPPTIVNQDLVPHVVNEEQGEKTAKDIRLPLVWGPQKLGAPPAVRQTFETYDEYKEDFLKALVFEMNYKIKEVFRIYEAAVFSSSRVPPKCPISKAHGSCKFIVDRKGNYCYICTHNGCKGFISVSTDTEIPQKYNKTSAIAYLRSKGIPAAEAVFLRNSKNTLLDMGKNVPDGEFSKDDVWLILYGDQAIFSCADGYGISSGSKVFLAPFFSDLNILPMNCKVMAIRVFNASSEKSAVLKLYNTNDLPIMPALLNGSPVEPIKVINAKELAEQTAKEYELNECQTEALMKVAEFMNGEAPILLVHGIFGAGKSKLLSVICVYLDRVLSLAGRDDKVLVSAITNVAVDNILNNLLKIDFENFTRVGSVKKISRDILPYTTGNSDSDSYKELISLNKQDPNDAVTAALKNAEVEKQTNKCRIESVRVTGVTCAASNFAVMQNRVFPFVLLDECSQQPEPLSFLPISFGCARLICCGDPMQLPPTISSHSPYGYGRPLFSRLIKTFPPVMLRIQYRCHPKIASICSRLFYNNKVESGISEEARAPYPGIATITIFDCQLGKEQITRGSFENRTEATTVVSLVQCLLKKDIAPKEIGVICFYKAQVDMISQRLMNGKRPVVDVSTVDAFQGDERDCIIITTTRTQCSSFVEMKSRVNVALSRAKRHLFIVTNVRSLCNSEIWGPIYQSAKGPNSVFKLDEAPPLLWDPFTNEEEDV